MLRRIKQLEDRLRRVEAENERLKQRLRQYEPVTGQDQTQENSGNLNYSVDCGRSWRRRARLRVWLSQGRRHAEQDPSPDLFAGIGVSDDAAVHSQRFREALKCWAHLPRKAIKLTLLYPGRQPQER